MKLPTILRKIKTMITRPISFAHVGATYVEQWRGHWRLISEGMRNELERVEAKCAVTGALLPNYMELWHLYSDVRQRQPKIIFEFGSGLSTNVLASALLANAEEGGTVGKLYSFESEQKWHAEAERWLPDALRPFVELIYSPTRVEVMFGVKVFKYSHIPEVTPNMVYLDGPGLTPEVLSTADMLDLNRA